MNVEKVNPIQAKQMELLKRKVKRYERIIKSLSKSGKIPKRIPISKKQLSKIIITGIMKLCFEELKED